jgi:hypothetical protein
VGGAAQPHTPNDSLNWYTGKAHSTITRYPKGEPGYERVRGDVMPWFKNAHP